MSGLYILTAPFLDDANTIKIGLSTNFAGRLKQYNDIFTNAVFKYVYKIDAELHQIREIENIVLYKTRHLRNAKLMTEYRLLTDECPLEYYKTMIVNEITTKGLTFVCDENFAIDKMERERFSEQSIKFEATDDIINNGKIEAIKKRFAEKLKTNIVNISNEFLDKYYEKEHVIDNVLYYLDIGEENNETMDKRTVYINKFVQIYGFKNLFDFKTFVIKDTEMEQRMNDSELLKQDKYVELMKCFGKRCYKKNTNVFSVGAFIILSSAIFGEYGIKLICNRHNVKKNRKVTWIHRYKLGWDKSDIGSIISNIKK